jgi:hypothetical protein
MSRHSARDRPQAWLLFHQQDQVSETGSRVDPSNVTTISGTGAIARAPTNDRGVSHHAKIPTKQVDFLMSVHILSVHDRY